MTQESSAAPAWNPATIRQSNRKVLLDFYRKVAPSAEEVQTVASVVKELLGNAPVVGASIQAATYLIQCAAQAQVNASKKGDVTKKAEFVKAKLKELEEMTGDHHANSKELEERAQLQLLAASCAMHKEIRTHWYDPVVACVCARCDSARLDEQASQLSNLLEQISTSLQKVIADRTPHVSKISPLVPDSSSLIQRRDKVMSLLNQQEKPDLVRVVGIYGMPGLGKTTIMYSVEAKIRDLKSHEYAIAFVEVGQKPLKPLHELQSDLTFALSGNNEKYLSTSHGRNRLIECLDNLRQKNKKACIFVDNVWEKSHLQDLLPEGLGASMPPSSYLVISSRTKSVVDELDSLCLYLGKKLHVYNPYNPDTLNEQEARDFFVNHAASRGPHLLPAHQELVDNIVPLCCGLPLLLKVYSSYLSKRTDQYERVAEKRRSCEGMPDEEKVFEILKKSLDHLTPEALQAFIDIALFYSQQDGKNGLNEIRHFLDEEYYLQDLIDQSLVSVKEDWEGEKIVGVHDLLRAVAANVNKEKKMVYLGLENEDEEVPPQDLDKVRVAIFREGWKPFIEKMSQLRYLAVTTSPHSLQSFSNIVQGSCCELRALKLEFDEAFSSQNQVEQSIQLWISSLMKLRFLELDNFPAEGVQLPENLHVLHIKRCSSLAELPASLAGSASLERLSLWQCAALAKLPDVFSTATALKEVDLSDCSSLAELPASLAGSASLERLSLRGCAALAKLPDVFSTATALKVVDLDDCSNLEELPASLAGSASLERLSLRRCAALAKLPDVFSTATALKEVDLDDCSSLAELPASLAGLQARCIIKVYN